MQGAIFTGTHGNNHIQGIAVDEKKGFVYYSFTTKLIKATLDGTLVGSVTGLTGHLGCIDFREADGKVYGSLEYKNDTIGKGIHANLGIEKEYQDAFYMTIFDVDKITRMDMDAERDGVMTAVYLKTVVDDYNGTGALGKPHRYGCSGIDGTTLVPSREAGTARSTCSFATASTEMSPGRTTITRCCCATIPPIGKLWPSPFPNLPCTAPARKRRSTNSSSTPAIPLSVCRIWSMTASPTASLWRYTPVRNRNSPITTCLRWMAR